MLAHVGGLLVYQLPALVLERGLGGTGDNTLAGWIPGTPIGMYASFITSNYAKVMFLYTR